MDDNLIPERVTAFVITAELVRTLNAHQQSNDIARLIYTAEDATITCYGFEAHVTVASEGYRLDLTVLPERIAIAFQGDYSGPAMLALYLLDWLHENEMIPTDPNKLSGAQLVFLDELRGRVGDAPEAA
jgi:hypothetical protein